MVRELTTSAKISTRLRSAEHKAFLRTLSMNREPLRIQTMVKDEGDTIVSAGFYATSMEITDQATMSLAGVVGLTVFEYGNHGIRCNVVKPGAYNI